MFFIAVIDDEQYSRVRLINLINKTLISHNIEYRIDEYKGAKEFLDAQKDYQLILLDIEMGEENGVELSRKLYKLNSEAIIVFVTSYDGYIKNAFGLNVYSYVMKEEAEERLPEVLINIVEEQNKETYMIVNTDLGPATYKYSDIVYFMIEQRKCYIQTITKRERIHFSTIKGIKERLNDSFLQPNAKYLINGKHIDSIENGVIVLSNSECVFISRGKVRSFLDKYKDYLIREG